MTVSVEEVSIRGLFGRLNLDVLLTPGVNVLYGRNGTGKTTILHVLANVLNGSFERFAFLPFDEVQIRFSNNRRIRIAASDWDETGQQRFDFQLNYLDEVRQQTGPKRISIQLDDAPPSSVDAIPIRSPRGRVASELSDPEYDIDETMEVIRELRQNLRDSLEVRPSAYFPAFRTMIEAWWSVESEERRPRLPRRRPPEIVDEDLFDFESQGRSTRRALSLTRFARRLFGEFVPYLSYPSPLEIEEELSGEVDFAAYRVAVTSRRILERAFIDAFAALASVGRQAEQEPEELLHEIERRLGQLEIAEGLEEGSESVYERLRESFPKIQTDALTDTAANVLAVYRESLNRRIEVQEEVFRPIEQYVASVNEFLENKQIEVDRRPLADESTQVFRSRPDSPKVYLRFADGSRAELRTLSSGERQIVSMLHAAARADGDVVLIDEPEISLHIEWQRMLLAKMSQQLGQRQVIVCTHSPEIGADYREGFQEIRPRSSRSGWEEV